MRNNCAYCREVLLLYGDQDRFCNMSCERSFREEIGDPDKVLAERRRARRAGAARHGKRGSNDFERLRDGRDRPSSGTTRRQSNTRGIQAVKQQSGAPKGSPKTVKGVTQMSSKTKRERAESSLGRFEYLTAAQKYYGETIDCKTVTVSTGCPGTGKTYVALYKALQALQNGDVTRIVATKPLVGVDGEEMGFMPGNADEKMAPFVQNIEDVLGAIVGAEAVRVMKSHHQLVFQPLNFMRGLTISDTFLVADEVQNCTYLQLKTLLTRIGENSKFVLDGDLGQIDIEKSGLPAFVDILGRVPDVGFVEFAPEDIVRSGIAKDITCAIYEYEGRRSNVVDLDPSEGLRRMLGN